MDVCLYNIQGFRGEYHYSLESLVSIINSKHNGVGKTTLYDCIKFLCDVNFVDKEEREYYLNLNEEKGLFSITRDGVTNGFILVKGRPVVFYRQVEGEEVEKSSHNFPNVSQEIGILVINEVLLNIFSKEVNLFSSSHSGKDYQLVKEISTHHETERMLENIANSLKMNQGQLSLLKAEKNGYDLQVDTLPYFTHINQLDELLNNPFYEELGLTLNFLYETLGKVKPISHINFSSHIEKFINLEDTLAKLQPSINNVPNADTLHRLDLVANSLKLMKPTLKEQVNLHPLESLTNITDKLAEVKPSISTTGLSVEVLENLQKLDEAINNLDALQQVEVNASLIGKLSSICIKMGEMTTQVNRAREFERLAIRNKESLASVKVACPIRQEVFLIDGKCVY